MPQYFKGDSLEIKFDAAGEVLISNIALQLDAFLADAYESQPFGDIIFADGRSPLANAISQDIYRETFNEVFSQFSVAGSFESYISVFEKIFGDSVDITLTVPGDGRLQIDIIAEGVDLNDAVARRIENNQYVLDELIDYEDDNIAFQKIKGFQSQYELEQMLFEMVPAGVFTEISLTLG
jgi:hypothetical protein